MVSAHSAGVQRRQCLGSGEVARARPHDPSGGALGGGRGFGNAVGFGDAVRFAEYQAPAGRHEAVPLRELVAVDAGRTEHEHGVELADRVLTDVAAVELGDGRPLLFEEQLEPEVSVVSSAVEW